jgi:hypothetical protein
LVSRTCATGFYARRDSTSEVAQISKRVYELDSLERARVLRALKVPTAEQSLTGGRVLGSGHRIAWFLVLCCIGLIPWTIGLALTLPRSYPVGNWPLAWTGFDIVLLVCLGTTAWALWRQRQVAVAASMITSALLLCDAWFDIVTAHSGRCVVVSLMTASFVEIPIALLLGVVSVRLCGRIRELLLVLGHIPPRCARTAGLVGEQCREASPLSRRDQYGTPPHWQPSTGEKERCRNE